MFQPPFVMRIAGVLWVASLTLFSGCDALEQLSGADPVNAVVRDNPVDPQSSRPLVFGLDSPDSIVGTVRPSVRFSLGDGVVSYSLQIATTAVFESPLTYQENGITEEVHRIAAPLANHGKYYWRVRPRYSDGTEGGWSNAKELEVELPVPGGLLPSIGGFVGSPLPSLSWTHVTSTGSYQIQFADDADFSTNESLIEAPASPAKLTSPRQDGSVRFWRVRVSEDGVNGDWSGPSSFQVALPVLEVRSPANGLSLHDLQFHWDPEWAADATGYQIEVNPDASFATENSFFASQSVSRTDPVELPLSLGTTYYWRVRARYPQGHVGSWSASGSFERDRVSRVIPLPFSSNPSLFVGSDGALWFAGNRLLGFVTESQSVSHFSTNVEFSEGELAGSDGTIYQIDSDSPTAGVKATSIEGVARWVFSTPNTIAGMALSEDGILYTAYWMRDTSPSTFRFVALTPSGAVKWSYDAPDGTTNRDSVVVTNDGTVCFATAEQVYAFSPSGDLKWTYPVDNAMLSAGKDGVLFIVDPFATSYSGVGLSVVDAEGQLQWQYSGGVRMPPVVDGAGNLYLSLGEPFSAATLNLACFSSSGDLIWSKPRQGIQKIIVADNQVLYTLDQSYPAPMTVHADRTVNGELLWTHQSTSPNPTDMNLGPSGNLYLMYNNQVQFIPTDSQGVDPLSPWPMTGGNPRGTRSAAP